MFRQGVDSLMEVLGHAELKAVQRYRSRTRERTRRAMQVFESGQASVVNEPCRRWNRVLFPFGIPGNPASEYTIRLESSF